MVDEPEQPRTTRLPSGETRGPGPTTFHGVSSHRGMGIKPLESLGTGLYEFFTADGDHVYLHGMDFVGFQYVEGHEPGLVVTFSYTGGVRPQGFAGPTVEFTFEDVRLLDCEDDLDEPVGRPAPGQTHLFEYRSDGIFCLTTLYVQLNFSARSCSVATR